MYKRQLWITVPTSLAKYALVLIEGVQEAEYEVMDAISPTRVNEDGLVVARTIIFVRDEEQELNVGTQLAIMTGLKLKGATKGAGQRDPESVETFEGEIQSGMGLVPDPGIRSLGLKKKKRLRQEEEENCLLYTSPSPRD